MTRFSTDLIIPMYKPGDYAQLFYDALEKQSLRFNNFIVVDSGSQQSEIEPFRKFGAEIHSIKSSDFNHGGTRNWAFNELSDVELTNYVEIKICRSQNAMTNRFN